MPCSDDSMWYVRKSDNVVLTEPIFIVKPLIVFKSRFNTIQNYTKLFSKLFKLWFVFFSVFCIISIILHLMNLHSLKHKISFYDYMNSFFGANKKISIDHTKAKLHLPYVFFGICIIIFALYLILNSLTATFAATYEFPNNSIDCTLEKQNILVFKHSYHLIKILKKSGANPILFDYHNERIIKHYLQNNEYPSGMHLDGVVIEPVVFKYYKLKDDKIFFSGLNEGLNISKVSFTYSEAVIPINKKRTRLLKKLNKYLVLLKENDLQPSNKPSNIIKKICKGKEISKNYSNLGNILNCPCKI